MRHTAGLPLVLILISTAPLTGAEIPTIQTLEQLAGLPSAKLDTGWQVRLGTSDGGKAAGPWRLIYCLAEHKDDDEQRLVVRHEGELFGERLGPVFFRVTAQPHRVAPKLAGQVAELLTLPRVGLYCAAVPTAWSGEYHVTVRSSDGAVVGTARFEVERAVPCYWQPFAEQRINDRTSVDYVVRGKTHAAIPRFQQSAPIWRPNPNVRWLHRKDGTPMPGRISVELPWSDLMRNRTTSLEQGKDRAPSLRLSLREDVFHVESDVDMLAWPDLNMLARWWVNGQPVIPERIDAMGADSMGRALRHAKLVKVALGLPDNLARIKTGDTVGLQVLYSPGRVRTLPKSRSCDQLLHVLSTDISDLVAVPLLSNKIEFDVTDAVVTGRGD